MSPGSRVYIIIIYIYSICTHYMHLRVCVRACECGYDVQIRVICCTFNPCFIFSFAAYLFIWRKKINMKLIQKSSRMKTLSQLNQTSTKTLLRILPLQPFPFLPTIQHIVLMITKSYGT